MDGWRGSLSRTICQNLPEKQEGLPEGANHHAASQGTRLSVEQACAGESKVQCGSAVEFLHRKSCSTETAPTIFTQSSALITYDIRASAGVGAGRHQERVAYTRC